MKQTGFSAIQLILITVFIMGVIGVSFYLGRSTASLQVTPSPTSIVTTPTITNTPNPTENWKTYKTQYKTSVSTTNINFQYPSEWTYKEEYAHGNADLGVFFSNPKGEMIMMFTYSAMNFQEDFYNIQSQYLGSLNPVKLANREGYLFRNKNNYLEAYYFPLGKAGYFSLALLDNNYLDFELPILQTMQIDFH